jgi:hypothetical protein
VYKPLYNTSVLFYNTITYYKQVINTLLYKVIIELRAFYIAFIVVISICFYFKTKTFIDFNRTGLERQERVV